MAARPTMPAIRELKRSFALKFEALMEPPMESMDECKLDWRPDCPSIDNSPTRHCSFWRVTYNLASHGEAGASDGAIRGHRAQHGGCRAALASSLRPGRRQSLCEW